MRKRESLVNRLLRLTAGVLLGGIVVSSSIAQEPTKQTVAFDAVHQLKNRDLRVNPPQVRFLMVKKLAGDPRGNALLVARVAETERLPSRFSIEAGGRVEFRDDGKGGDRKAGDGLFSAIVKLTPAELASIKTRGKAFREAREFTSFDGRSAIKVIPSKFMERLPQFPPDFDPIPPIDFPFPPSPPFPPPPPPIIVANSLMITDLGVVNDPSRTFDVCGGPGNTPIGTPGGKWTFQHLMEEMANQPATGIDPSDFVAHWLNRWMFDQVINDWLVSKRPSIATQVISPWPKLASGKLDLSKAPMRLLAIVNRVDLRQNLIYGGGSAGEARFVFGVLGPGCSTLPFTVIFEYGIRKPNCFALKGWAQQWANLSTMTVGSAPYNTALQAITEQFVLRNSDPTKPNGSALNQLRTNEIALSSPWELREFKIFDSDSDAHHLREVTVKQTPDISLNNSGTLDNYLTSNMTDILAGTYQVPLESPPGSHFLGGSAPVPTPSFFWSAPAAVSNYPLREKFSLGTCNGCHGGETRTTFLHIGPRAASSQAALSQFLTGTTPDVNDPGGTANSAHFEDLTRRRNDLTALLNTPCLFEILHVPLLMTH